MRTQSMVRSGLLVLHFALLLTLFALARSPVADAQDDWRLGEIVGLREGTCIREGPGFDYRAHTRVPEDNWTVTVIDGPREEDGRTWYDTSRRAAGDPSGGTGWVDRSQTDMCPDAGPSRPQPPASPGPGSRLDRIRDWWSRQGAATKWLLAIVVLGGIASLWYKLALSIWVLARLAVFGFVIWWVLDRTRELWSPHWYGALGPDAPDLAILLALAPAISWVVPRLLSSRRWR